MNKTYYSKRDWWISVLLWVAAIGMVLAALDLLSAPLAPLLRLAMVSLLGAMGPLVLWLLYGTYYVLSESDLLIRSGPFRWRVALDDITEVFPTRNPLSSPACSLDRLWIRYQGSRFGVMISPQEQGRFLQELRSRAPQLEQLGQKLVSTQIRS